MARLVCKWINLEAQSSIRVVIIQNYKAENTLEIN